jgi:hypothetical protein
MLVQREANGIGTPVDYFEGTEPQKCFYSWQMRIATEVLIFLDCWHHFGIHWDFGLGFYNMMEKAKCLWPHAFFMECFIIGAWLIWKQRNDAIFNHARPSLLNWKKGFLEEASLQVHRLLGSKKPLVLDIVNTFR